MAGIPIGTQLNAPNGFKNLDQGVTYYFLRSSPTIKRVMLIEYLQREPRLVHHKSARRPQKVVTPEPVPLLIRLERSDFEEGLSFGKIVRNEEQHTMPPWLEGLEDLNLDCADEERRTLKVTHKARIDRKVKALSPLLENIEQLMNSDNFEKEINRHARAFAINETRMRCWLFTYLLFGRSSFSLHYPIHRIGHFDRLRTVSSAKRGRPATRGKDAGYNSDAAMIEKIVRGYRRECGPGIEMSEIYASVIEADFGCTTRQRIRGKKKYLEIWHPDGKPFPRLGVFEYYVAKKFTHTTVQRTVLGHVRARSKIMPTRGPFTQHTWNLMQRVEADAYAVMELARGLVDSCPLPPLYVTTKRDTASGIKTGIGFSQGAEESSAYRMATFCEAISKDQFCRLFGIVISAERWPSQGVSPHDIRDRGPGATVGGVSRTDEFAPVISGMAPSYSGQSKAVIESSHPNNASNDEAPSFILSSFRTFELVRREIFKVLEFNESCSVRDRIPPDLADKVARNSPNALYQTLDSLGRNDAVNISFDEAVRAYLDRTDAELTREGVRFHGQIYRSAALDATDACASATGKPALPISAYSLQGCIRHIWLEWHGRLIEVDLHFAVPVANDVLYMSLEELKQFEEYQANEDCLHQDHRLAAKVRTRVEFRETDGRSLNSGYRKNGRPNRGSPAAKQEAAEAKAAVSGRKAA